MKSLGIIGAGSVGRTLGRLWHDAKVFEVDSVCNRTGASAEKAIAFIGAGSAVESLSDFSGVEVLLVCVSDNEIPRVANQLLELEVVSDGMLIFHCSGALSSEVFEKFRAYGAVVASLHPAKSFADPSSLVASFAGTHCALEGDAAAVDILTHAIESIGGSVFTIDAKDKLFYHAGMVFVSNYLASLLEVGFQVFEKAGVARERAHPIISPMLQETLSNNLKLGGAKALTGPIARGDFTLVAQQIEALEAWRPEIAALYVGLGNTALELSEAKGVADSDSLVQLKEILERTADDKV